MKLATMPPTTPVPVWIGAFLIPYLIAYLVHFPQTRGLCLGLFPLGVFCGGWLIATINIADEPLFALPFVETTLKWNLVAGTRFAFLHRPPVYPPLPAEPFFARVRHSTPFRAFNLLLDANRLVSLRPITEPHVPYLRALALHLGAFLFHKLVVDTLSYPAHFLGIGPDHPKFGLQTWVGAVWWRCVWGGMMYQGTAMVLELIAFVGIASGLYTGEEWPKVFHNPLASSSLIEWWGTRYHTLMRDFFTRMARPFEVGPQPLRFTGVFLVSGLYHIIQFYPFTRRLEWWPHMTFWFGCALGCALEWAFYKATGRRVGGIQGKMWMFAWLCFVSGPLVSFDLHRGACSRDIKIGREGNGEGSLLVWILYALGLSPAWFEILSMQDHNGLVRRITYARRDRSL